MRIVHVVRQFWPALGGLESVVLELATTQVKQGHSVRIVTLDRLFHAREKGVLPPCDFIGEAEVVRIPFFGSPRYPIALSAIRHIADADIVHVHGTDFFFDYLGWTKPFHRRQLVVSTHGGFFHTPFAARLKRLYFSTITRWSMIWYAGVAAVSKGDYELFNSIRQRGIVCIENGVNASRFFDASSKTPTKSIISLGRLSKNKGLESLISFLAALRRKDQAWKLRLLGRQWDVAPDNLLKLAQVAGVDDAIDITVSPSDEVIRHAICGCSVFASASEYEGFGLAAVEGMSAGLFPLLSDIPPFRRLLEPNNVGLIVDFRQADAAAAQFLEKWSTIESDYYHYRTCSMLVASKFDWRYVSNAYQTLYEAAIGTKTRAILNVPIQATTFGNAVEFLDSRFKHENSTLVAFANAHTLNVASKNAEYLATLQASIVLNDGVGLDIASQVLFGSPFPENLNGTDFVPRYLKSTQNRYRVFLLGGVPGVAERVAAQLSVQYPRHQIVGCCDGYFAPEGTATVVNRIRLSAADVLLVAMASPKQELWLNDNLAATGCRLGFGVGALFDFIAGEATRAPAWVQVLRLEWLYQLFHEPRRLWRRYLIGNLAFILRILGQWCGGARVGGLEPTDTTRARAPI